jgi:hypothetical protein
MANNIPNLIIDDDAMTTFINYTNQQIFNHNLSFLEAIQVYLLDNNIPVYFKQINYIANSIQNIANNYNNELNIFHNYNYINNQYNGPIFQERVLRTLLLITDVRNILNQINQIQH